MSVKDVSNLVGFSLEKLEKLSSCGKLKPLKWVEYEDWDAGVLYSSNEVWRFIKSGRKRYVGVVREEDAYGYTIIRDYLIGVCGVDKLHVNIYVVRGSGVTEGMKKVIKNIRAIDCIILSPNKGLFYSKSTDEFFKYMCCANDVDIKYATEVPTYDEVNDSGLVLGQPYQVDKMSCIIESCTKGVATGKEMDIKPRVLLSDREYYSNLIRRYGRLKIFNPSNSHVYDILSEKPL